MKLIVRVMAEAQGHIKNTELIKLEDVFLKKITQQIIKQLEKNSPYQPKWRSRKGEKLEHLRKEWYRRKLGMAGFSIYNRLAYAQYLAKGTGIYGPRGVPIRPVDKKAMRFYYSYIHKWIVTKKVMGINPATFGAMLDRSQYEGTRIGIERALADQENKWRGTLQTKLTRS